MTLALARSLARSVGLRHTTTVITCGHDARGASHILTPSKGNLSGSSCSQRMVSSSSHCQASMPSGRMNARTTIDSCLNRVTTPGSSLGSMGATFTSSSSAQGRMQPFVLADIGEGITECELIQWFVKEGDRVEQFQKICEVQSDKAAVEISSRYDGVISKVHYEKGDMAKVGKPLVDILLDGEDAPATSEPKKKVDPGSGEPAKDAKIVKEAAGAHPIEGTTATMHGSKVEGGGGKVLTTPAVRRIAREHGINLADVVATGPQGRILKGDVLAFIEGNQVNTSPASSGQSHGNSPVGNNSIGSTTQRVPVGQDAEVQLTQIQKVMFKTMTASLAIPHLGFSEEILLDETSRFRRDVNKYLAQNKGNPATMGVEKLTYMPIFIKAFSECLKRYPLLNAAVVDRDPSSPADMASKHLLYRASHNIGFAMDSPQGLVVPNIKNVQTLSILEIAGEMDRIKAQVAKTGSVSPNDLRGGTITLSNIGNVGGTVLHPVLVPNEVCIAALGRVQQLPRFDESGNVYKAEVLAASLNADHRVVDGATVAKFVRDWKMMLETPAFLALALR